MLIPYCAIIRYFRVNYLKAFTVIYRNDIIDEKVPHHSKRTNVIGEKESSWMSHPKKYSSFEGKLHSSMNE